MSPQDERAFAALKAAGAGGDLSLLLENQDVVRLVARPGDLAGAVEGQLLRLPGSVSTALRRAARHCSKARVSRLTPEAVLPLLVEHGKIWWVRDGESYLAVDSRVAATEIGRLHPGARTTMGTASGGERQMTAVEAYAEHGVTARKVRWTYNADGSKWDSANRVLDLPGARVNLGRSARSERVEEWLECLTNRPATLLDWLATASRLDRPTSAVQLRGRDSIGKAMLAAGLATFLGGRVDYRHATGEFNAGLIHGPLVLLDEGAADAAPDAFRSLTGNAQHQVCEKHRMPEELLGCPRVLVTSNEKDPLRLGVQELSSHSEHALGRRMIILDGQDVAARYLERLGGWGATQGWCESDGELVAHLRWLSDSRVVEPGNRFLVEGDASEWVATAHLREGVGNNVVQAWATYQDMVADNETHLLVNPQPFFPPDARRPELQDHVGISVSGLQANWSKLVEPGRRPASHQQLSKILKRLSGQEKPQRLGPQDNRGSRVYLVPTATLSDE